MVDWACWMTSSEMIDRQPVYSGGGMQRCVSLKKARLGGKRRGSAAAQPQRSLGSHSTEETSESEAGKGCGLWYPSE